MHKNTMQLFFERKKQDIEMCVSETLNKDTQLSFSYWITVKKFDFKNIWWMELQSVTGLKQSSK